MSNLIERYFVRKKKYWFVVAESKTLDPSVTGFNRLRCLNSFREFSEVLGYIKARVGNDKNLIIVKSSAWVHPGDIISQLVVISALSPESSMYRDIVSMVEDGTHSGILSTDRISDIKEFLNNKGSSWRD